MKSQLSPEANAYNFPVHLRVAVYYILPPSLLLQCSSRSFCERFACSSDGSMMVQPSVVNKIRSLFTKQQSAPNFQVLSDLHLELCSQYHTFSIAPVAPYLILAGDIGRLIDYEGYLAFLAKQTAQFEKVFLVLGNHEFYHLSHTSALEQAQRLENEAVLNGKLVLCHQKRRDIDLGDSQTTILGCTLWSKIDGGAREAVQTRIKDLQKITEWSIDDHNTAHISDLTWLFNQVRNVQNQNKCRAEGEPERKILVITHHAPTIVGTSSPKNSKNPWGSAFATEILGDSSMSWIDVKVWVFGHTHFTTKFEKDGIRVLSNQRGYVLPGSEGKKDEKFEETAFDPERVFGI